MAGRDPDFRRLARIMEDLRAPSSGCPWDLEQTLSSLRPYLVEEAYEVLEVMDGDDPALHCEELGDLLFQVVFHAQIRAEQGSFEMADVVDGISDKLTRRHPHVFDGEHGSDAKAAEARWEERKGEEGKGDIHAIPKALPALVRATKVGQAAARVGFDWPDMHGPLAKLEEEVAELRDAAGKGHREHVAKELGDVLFAAVNVARHAQVDAEQELRGTTERFLRRLAYMEAKLEERDLTLRDVDLDGLEALWQEAKRWGEATT